MCQSVLDRYEDCCKVDGGHFEHCVVLCVVRCVSVIWTDMTIVARFVEDILSTVLYCELHCVLYCVRVFWTDMKIVARLKVDTLST